MPYWNPPENEGPYHAVLSMRENIKNKVKMHAYPMLNWLGLVKIDIHWINDPQTAREVFLKNDAAYGHLDMKGWFDLNSEYRFRTKKDIFWETCSADETGMLRDIKRSDPAGTKIGKQCRKRVMEVLAKKSLEPVWVDAIEREIPKMIRRMKEEGKNGKVAFYPFDNVTMPAAMSVLLGVSFNIDCSTRESWIRKMIDYSCKALHTLTRLDGHKLFLVLIPRWMRNLIPLSFWPKWTGELQGFTTEIIEMIEEHNKNWQVGDESPSLIAPLETDRQKGLLKYWDIVHTLQAMILAGADTTATSTASCMRQLAMNPPVQEKLFNVLNAQDFRADSFADCHYLMAVIYESYRMCPMVWRSLFHVVTEDMKIEDYNFSKDDFLAYSHTGVCFSEIYFPEPLKFKPERFLDEQGEFKKNENLMPFFIGKRSCPGQILANLEVFHFMKNMIKEFRFEVSADAPIDTSFTEDGWHTLWSHGAHKEWNHHFLLPAENKILCIPRN
ncbi:unnamed protein product [Oikopleura dioica]|uniref:Cytochrome P450 n=1 Tax=Oikopleura dioica TaxID=34765 RepID=E4XY58_OIKDI|nr:unnamed protein product [Oikopleura dioica]